MVPVLQLKLVVVDLKLRSSESSCTHTIFGATAVKQLENLTL